MTQRELFALIFVLSAGEVAHKAMLAGRPKFDQDAFQVASKIPVADLPAVVEQLTLVMNKPATTADRTLDAEAALLPP